MVDQRTVVRRIQNGGTTRDPGDKEDYQEALQEYSRGRVSKTGAEIEAIVEAD